MGRQKLAQCVTYLDLACIGASMWLTGNVGAVLVVYGLIMLAINIAAQIFTIAERRKGDQ